MSSLLGAVSDDIREYQLLCSLYGEEVQYEQTAYGSSLPDCYGEHAKKLKDKNYGEM